MYEKIELNNIHKDLDNFIDDKTLDMQYEIYEKNLEKLNYLLQKSDYDYAYSLLELIKNIEVIPLQNRAEVLYYLSSVLNHQLYFYNISSLGNTSPINTLKKDIDKYFGSFSKFQDEFIKKAMELKGSGYTFLVQDKDGKLFILNTSNEDSPYYYEFTPIISLDLWEHAYLLKYGLDRESYILNFF